MGVKVIGRVGGGEQYVVAQRFQPQGYFRGDGRLANAALAHGEHHALALVVERADEVVESLVVADAFCRRCFCGIVFMKQLSDVVHRVHVVGAQRHIQGLHCCQRIWHHA